MLKQIFNKREMPVLIGLIVLIVVIGASSSVFLRADNISDLIKTNSILAVCVLGLTPVLISGGIDISIGSVIGVCGCVCAGIIEKAFPGSVAVAIAATLLTGILIGVFNGFLVSVLKIPPIVATLGMQTIIKGVMMLVTRGAWLNVPKEVTDFGLIKFFATKVEAGGVSGVPIQLLFVIAFALLTFFILKYTMLGRGIYAVGGSLASAERIGYRTKLIQIFVYAYMGFACGLVGFLHTSMSRQVDPNTYIGYELNVIAAAFLGGASDGEGSIFGAILGVLFVSVLKNGLTLMKISSYWHNIVIGLIIVVSVAFDAIQVMRKEAMRTRVDVEE